MPTRLGELVLEPTTSSADATTPGAPDPIPAAVDATPAAAGEPAEQDEAGAHELTEGKVRLSLDRVVNAARSLVGLRLKRAETAAFLRWLARKRAGMTVTTPAVWDNAFCIRFAQDLLAVPGEGAAEYYNPFNGSRLGSDASDWPIQVLYSQLHRQRNKSEQPLYREPEAVEPIRPPAEGERRLAAYRQEVTSAESYNTGLAHLLSTPVPLRELAVWRYRYDELDGDIDEDQLVARFLAEFNISDEERDALFTLEAPTLVTTDTDLVAVAGPDVAVDVEGIAGDV